MSEVKLVKYNDFVGEDYTIETKRLHLPYSVEAKCPLCKDDVIVDLSCDYISDPCMNKLEYLPMYCNRCDHEWNEGIIVKVSLELPRKRK